jgi:polyisoprenoid-binding protein YceI
MKLLALLLFASAAAQADQVWVFEPGQALVSVELGPARARLSATSLGMSGRVRELDGGAVQAEVRLSVASFATGSPKRDQELRRDVEAGRFAEIVFDGAAPAPDKNGTLRLQGTVSFHGASRALEVPVSVVRTGHLAFGHATFLLHLRDFGFALPAGVSDELRVDVDAGLRPESALASRG